jgi:peptide/nickel transport system ATP-binding protein
MSLLEISNLSLNINSQGIELPILRNVEFTINQGDVLAIVGESGCGKSITALSITKLIPEKISSYISGSILFNKKDILKFSKTELESIRGKEISYIFQDPFSSLNPLMKIKDQIVESYLLHISNNYNEAIQKAEYLLNKVGINDVSSRMESYPGQLSGGMLQRVSIAMALMCDPKLLIADEPTSALDVTIQSQLLDLLIQLKRENNMAILFISHDIGLVSNIADNIIVMYAGQVIEESNYLNILQNSLHPYTKALIESVPTINSILNGKELVTISGIVPSPQNYPNGCNFSDRCNAIIDKCTKFKPDYFQRESSRVRCFLHEDLKK